MASRTSVTAELFHFGTQPRDLEAELFLLSPGGYDMTLTTAGSDSRVPLQQQVFHVEGPRTRVAVQLPSRRLCVMRVNPRKP